MYTGMVSFEYDPNKAAANVRKHGVQFSEAVGVFSDDYAITSTMKDTYDFSKGRRGRVVAEPRPEPGKVRITIRLDEDLVDYFGALADRSGGKVGYQTLINSALREYVEGKTPKWEETLRRIIREEMGRNSAA